MPTTKLSHLLFILSLLGLFVLSYLLQHNFFLSGDVLSFIYEAKQLLAGGSYTQHFFETNPPLIIYLSIPPLLLIHLLNISAHTAIFIYIFSLITLSLLLCQKMISLIFHTQDTPLARLFLFSLTAILLLCPMYAFGQREHLLLIFSFPYLLLMVNRLHLRTISPYLAVLIGCMAGVGFSLKPFFLLTPAFIELFYLYHQRRSTSLIRPETISIIAIITAYLCLAFVYNHDYFTVILPYISHLYYASVGESWRNIAHFSPLLFCSSAVLFYLIEQKNNPYRMLLSVLTLALCAFILIFIIERTFWFYHLLPAISLTILINVFLFAMRLSNVDTTHRKYILLTLFILFLLSFLYSEFDVVWSMFISSQTAYFIYLSLLSFSILSIVQKNTLVTLASVCIIITCTIYSAFALLATDFYTHRFALTLLLFLMLFALSLSFHNIYCKKFHFFFMLIFGLCLFTYAYLIELYEYYLMEVSSHNIEIGIAPIKKNLYRKTVFFFTTSTLTYPIIELTHANSASRFPFFWMVGGINKLNHTVLNPHDQQQLLADKNFFVNMVTEDLATNKPDYVFVEMIPITTNPTKSPLNLVLLFSQNALFTTFWRQYHYVQTLSIPPINIMSAPFVFQVYTRNPVSATILK